MGMGICGGAPSSFLVSQRASGGRPRPPRLSSAGATRDLSQRPGRALVRRFVVVPAIRTRSEFSGFICRPFAVQLKRCPTTRGAPWFLTGKPVKGLGEHSALAGHDAPG